MNLFFGKISKQFDTRQIEEGYYQAPRGSAWFGNIQTGDYAYIIGGDKVQFWRAKEWRVVDGNDRLYFEILNSNLGISVNDLIALNILKLSKALLVLTSRSARKAFFEIELLDQLEADQLAATSFYQSEELYRSIRIVREEAVNPASKDIQLYYKDNQLQLAPALFYEDEVYHAFRDNLKFLGQGSRYKDTILSLVKNNLGKEAVFSRSQIGFRAFYDAFFCSYKESVRYFLVGAFWDGQDPEDQTDIFVRESRWENGYNDKFIEETKAIPEGSMIAIKSAYVKERTKSVMKIKARGKVLKNYGDGKRLDVAWEKNMVPFEVEFGGYLTTVKEVTNKDHIAAIWENDGETPDEINMHNDIINLLKYKKQIILQGPPGTGKTRMAKEIAEQLNGSKSVNEDANDGIQATQYGEEAKGQAGVDNVKLIQFHPSFSYEDFVRGIVAESKGDKIEYKSINKVLGSFAEQAKQSWDNFHKDIAHISRENRAREYFDQFVDDLTEKLSSGEPVKLTQSVNIIDVEEDAFRYKGADGWSTLGNRMPFKDILQAFLDDNKVRQDIKKNKNLSGLAIQHASYFIRVLNMFQDYLTQNSLTFDQLSTDKEALKNYVLIIDEINRANLSSVLGELIYALEYRGEVVEITYGIDGNPDFVLPPNLYIIGTMNTADRSVGHIDYAIRRRFAFVDVLPEDLSVQLGDRFHKPLFDKVADLFDTHLSPEFEKKDVQLGHSYFIDKTSEGGPMSVRLHYEIKPILMEYIKDGILVGDGIKEKIEALTP